MPLTDVTRKLDRQVDLREGDFSDAGLTTDVLTWVNGEVIVVPFGRALIYAPTATGIRVNNIMKMPDTAGQVIRGISLATDTIERMPNTIDASGSVGYPPNQTGSNIGLTIMGGCAVKGMMAVKATEAVVKGDAVSTIITAGATRGAFAKTVDAARIACPSTWEWFTTTAVNGIGLIWMK
jgi:hypothetical protein